MTLIGYLAFLDPPKASAAEAIKNSEKDVYVKVLTGDNRRRCAAVCKKWVSPLTHFFWEKEVENLSEDTFAQTRRTNTALCKTFTHAKGPCR